MSYWNCVSGDPMCRRKKSLNISINTYKTQFVGKDHYMSGVNAMYLYFVDIVFVIKIFYIFVILVLYFGENNSICRTSLLFVRSRLFVPQVDPVS